MALANKMRCDIQELKLAPAESEQMTFTGYGAVFGNVDAYGDMIQKGAFSAFISDVKNQKQAWPAMLLQHGGWGISSTDQMPVGIWSDLAEDDKGLKLEGQLADTQTGIESYKLLKMQPRPAITGLSIGYYAREVEYGGKNDPYERLIKKIDVLEISLVTFPANDKARVTSVKSAPEYDLKQFERFLREAGFSKKEALAITNHGYKSLQSMRDAESEEMKQLAAAIQRNTNLLKV